MSTPRTTKRQATPVLLQSLFLPFAFVSLVIFYMIPLLLSFARVGSTPAYFEPLLFFCKYEKPEYHTTNDDQIDESEDMLTDGGKEGRMEGMRYSGGKHTRHLNRWTQSNA
jgi:hypothetical protein